MWQTPNQKARNAGARRTTRVRQKVNFHLKRVTAEIRSVGKRTDQGQPTITGTARMLLNDLTVRGVDLFSTESFFAGQEVAITLAAPTMIYLRGRVSFCQERAHGGTHIITQTPFSYRIGIEFVFETPAEEEAVAKYCEAVAATLAGKVA